MSTRCTISLTPRLHAYQDAYDDPPGMVWLEITSDGFSCDSGTNEVVLGMPLAEWDAAVEAYVAARERGSDRVLLAALRLATELVREGAREGTQGLARELEMFAARAAGSAQ